MAVCFFCNDAATPEIYPYCHSLALHDALPVCWVAWGAVPTNGPFGNRPERLWHALSSEWASLTAGGCDPVQLREQAIITPACGMASHDEAQADLVVTLTNQVARRLQTQTEGMRLTVGA